MLNCLPIQQSILQLRIPEGLRRRPHSHLVPVRGLDQPLQKRGRKRAAQLGHIRNGQGENVAPASRTLNLRLSKAFQAGSVSEPQT